MEIVAGVFALGLAAVASVFWVWMIVDCATKESDTGNTKVVWILVIVLAGIIGAAIYYFARRPKRDWERNSGNWSVYNRANQ
jgi:prolipoprotein diacylglyceryltransferase